MHVLSRGFCFVEHDADRKWERAVAGALQIVGEMLDARLVRYGSVGIGIIAGRLARVAAARSVHVVKAFGIGVIRREVAVRQRPCR